jgi:uncharacterized protein YbjQ (UPF0145 family)
MVYSSCPNCSKSVTGFFSSTIIKQSDTDFINKYLAKDKPAYCTGCADTLLSTISQQFASQKADIQKRLMEIIHFLPVLSSPAPNDWDYEVLEMVTSQTTSGTGFLTELSRSFNDLFGAGSNTTNRKIAAATNFCKADLKSQCLNLGGNAVISTDIDFNEIGAGSTNMLMVCMAGTAVRLRDLSSFGEERKEKIVEIVELNQKLEALKRAR